MKKFELLKNSSLLLIIINLNYAYINFVYPKFLYAGFKYEFNFLKLLESLMFLFIIVKLTDTLEKNRISYSFFNILFLVNYIPINIYYYLANAERKYFFCVSLAYILILIILKYLKIYKVKMKRIYISPSRIANILLIYTLIIYLYVYIYISKPQIDVLFFKGVYEKRGEIVIKGVFNYLIIWQGYVINTYNFVYAYINKKYFILFFVLLIQLFLYLMIPHKTFLFELVIVYISMKLFKKKQYVKLLFILLAMGLTLINIITKISTNIILASLFIRRSFFLPALLNNIYFDYVKKGGELLFYSEGVIGKVFNLSYPYDVSFPRYIGAKYFSAPQMAANTGLFADAYVNLGSIGIFIISIILGVFFKLLDTFENEKKIILFGMYSFIIMNLVNGSLLTWFLTGGGILPILLLFFIKDNKVYKIK